MSKIYYLEHTYCSEVEGNTTIPVVVSTDKRQLDQICLRLNKVSGEKYTVHGAFDYLPKNQCDLVFLTYSDSDWDWSYHEILGIYLNTEKAKPMIEKKLSKCKIAKDKMGEHGNCYLDKFPILTSLPRKEIHRIMNEANSNYIEVETELKSKENGTYWTIDV